VIDREHGNREDVFRPDQLVEHPLELHREETAESTVGADSANQGVYQGMRLLIEALPKQFPFVQISLILPRGKYAPDNQQ